MSLAVRSFYTNIRPSTGVLIAVYSCFIIIYLVFTSGTNWKYSIDLQVLKDVAGIYPFTDDPIAALADNSFLVWISLVFDRIVAVDTSLELLYLFAFALKTALLLRYFGLSSTLALTLLFFFAIDLNQARLSLCLSMLLLAWNNHTKQRIVPAVVFSIFGMVLHYPAGAALMLFYFVTRYPKATSIVAIASGSGAALAMFSEDSPLIRYLIYFNADSNDNTTSSFFLIALSLVILYWRRLSTAQAAIALGAVFISFISRDFLSLSGRLAELTSVNICIYSFIVGRDRSEATCRSNLLLFVATGFFLYRFNQWVIQGNMPLPSNI